MSELAIIAPLDGLAATVEREHAEVASHVRQALSHALAAGNALLQAQTELRDEPSFERWVEERGLHYRTAQKYMRLSAYREQLEALPEFDDLSMTRAHLYLRGLPKRQRADEERDAITEEIKRLHAAGTPQMTIAHALGVHKTTVRWHTDPEYRERKTKQDSSALQTRRVERREEETVRRLEVRGGPLQEAHHGLAGIEDVLGRAKDASHSADERRDIQRAIDSLTEAKHWLARAIRSDLDHNHRTKVKHAA